MSLGQASWAEAACGGRGRAPRGESCRGRGTAEVRRGDGPRGLGNSLLSAQKAAPCEPHEQALLLSRVLRPVGCGVGSDRGRSSVTERWVGTGKGGCWL